MKTLTLLHDFNSTQQILNTVLIVDNDVLSECKICTDSTHSLWNIIYWHTNKQHIHEGYGKIVLGYALKILKITFGNPYTIEYLWNGVNEYVYKWLAKNFDPICVSQGEEGTGSIYRLDKNKVLQFFDLSEGINENIETPKVDINT